MTPQELQLIKEHSELLQQFMELYGKKPKTKPARSKKEEMRLTIRRRLWGLEK